MIKIELYSVALVDYIIKLNRRLCMLLICYIKRF